MDEKITTAWLVRDASGELCLSPEPREDRSVHLLIYYENGAMACSPFIIDNDTCQLQLV